MTANMYIFSDPGSRTGLNLKIKNELLQGFFHSLTYNNTMFLSKTSSRTKLSWSFRKNIACLSTYSNVVTDMTRRGLMANMTRCVTLPF
jgi:hypothetical protein